jgi:hypothetical protein
MPKLFAVCCLEVVIGMIYNAAPELRSVKHYCLSDPNPQGRRLINILCSVVQRQCGKTIQENFARNVVVPEARSVE